MKVLFLTSTFPRFSGDGQSPFVLEQAIAWRQARPQDAVYVLAPGDNHAKSAEEIEGIFIHRFTYFWPTQFQKLVYPALLPNLKRNPLLFFQLPFLFFFEFIYVMRYTSLHNIDLIYSHWVIPQGLIAFILHLVRRVEYVVHNHSADLRLLVKLPLLGNWLGREIIRKSKYFFCVNLQLKNEALQLFTRNEQKLIEPKIKVFPMGYREEVRRENLESRIFKSEKFDIGFIGRLTEKKGVSCLIDTVSKLSKEIKVGIAGEGERGNELRLTCKELRIKFLGHISGIEKSNFMQRVTVFVFPSLSVDGDIEGMPVALLEALALNKIIVASTATHIQLLPEWNSIKQNVFILKDPTNVKQFATILSSALQKKPSDIRNIMRKYEWRNLIIEYQKLLIV